MRVIGLTGGIAMGKSHAAALFRRRGVPVFDADAEVHRLQGAGGAAVQMIQQSFPGTVQQGKVDRAALRRVVLGHPERLRQLESIVHPLVRDASRRFLARNRRAGTRIAVLEVPLLLETRQASEVHLVAVVTAPKTVQMQRLRRRGRMTGDQIVAVLARQMPDRDRCRRADVVIRTGLSRRHTQVQIHRLIDRLS
jgi:dephospho-CoA kinase